MAELNYVLNENYSKSMDSLKNTSYDKDNDIYLCQSQKSVIDFDFLVKRLYPQKQPSSYDALLVEEDLKKAYCIEFKNQKKSDIDNKEIEKKLKNSREILKDICNKHNIPIKNYQFIFCVVYKNDENKYKYRNRIETREIHFGLEKFIGEYFDNIITNDINFFTREFTKKYSCNN